MFKSLFASQFEEDEEEKSANKKEAVDQAKDEYEFDGYKIELNEKIMLMPVTLTLKK